MRLLGARHAGRRPAPRGRRGLRRPAPARGPRLPAAHRPRLVAGARFAHRAAGWQRRGVLLERGNAARALQLHPQRLPHRRNAFLVRLVRPPAAPARPALRDRGAAGQPDRLRPEPAQPQPPSLRKEARAVGEDLRLGALAYVAPIAEQLDRVEYAVRVRQVGGIQDAIVADHLRHRADARLVELAAEEYAPRIHVLPGIADRKSTRLNSSHGYISYAVFCLKKKKLTSGSRAPGSPLRIIAAHPPALPALLAVALAARAAPRLPFRPFPGPAPATPPARPLSS